MNEENRFDNLANELKHVERTQKARISSWAIVHSRIKKKKFNVFPAIVTCTITVVVALFLIITINDNNPTYQNANQDIPFVEVSGSMFTIEYNVANMDRGQYEYITIITRNKIVIDPLVKNYQRGDVVYYKTPEYINGIQGLEKKNLSLRENLGLNIEENQISRVVGLPGEKIEIRKGQVYINDTKLETFYSFPAKLETFYSFQAMRRKNMTGYFKWYFKSAEHKNSTMTLDDFEENMNAIIIPKDTVFLLGDQWSRSIDSRLFGPLSLTTIHGKVIGYEKSQ
jgi:signal peptidase I